MKTRFTTVGFGAAIAVVAALALLAVAAVIAIATPAPANWLTKIAKDAGEAGGAAGKVGIGNLDAVARTLKGLPDAPNTAAVAAHLSPEGHWTFVNRSGETYTAGTKDELARFAATVAPETVTSNQKLALYLTEDSVFENPKALDDLPPEAKLHIASKDSTFPIERSGRVGEGGFIAIIRPNVRLALTDKQLYREALWHLQRPLNPADMRILSLQPGGPNALSGAPRFDPATKIPMIDVVDPWTLQNSMRSLRGQTVVVTGRVDAEALVFQPKTGAEQTLQLSDLRAAANANDVNLVILKSSATRQPGGRNWFWQTVKVDGLEDAVRRANFADFLNGFGAERGAFTVQARSAGQGRIRLEAIPEAGAAEPITGVATEWFETIVSEVTGNLATAAIEADFNTKAEQREQDLRIFPWLPSVYQFLYLGSLIAGLIGLPYTNAWWRRIWPPEQRASYRGWFGFAAARAVRLLLYWVVFLPLVGIPAFVTSIVLQVVGFLMLPVTAARWIFGKVMPKSG